MTQQEGKKMTKKTMAIGRIIRMVEGICTIIERADLHTRC